MELVSSGGLNLDSKISVRPHEWNPVAEEFKPTVERAAKVLRLSELTVSASADIQAYRQAGLVLEHLGPAVRADKSKDIDITLPIPDTIGASG